MAKQTKTKEKEQKFELSQLEPKHLVELSKWEELQKKTVKENPFVEIKKYEDYETAKKHRTALVTARTSLQKQDTAIGSKLSKFRKAVKAETERLIAITLPHEEKQQEAVKEYEAEIEKKRLAKEKEEEDRINGIQEVIAKTKQALQSIIDETVYENIEQQSEKFEKEQESWRESYNFEEYEVVLDEAIEDLSLEFASNAANLEMEYNRQVELDKEREGNTINEYSVIANEIIYETPPEEHDGILDRLKKLFGKNPKLKYRQDEMSDLISKVSKKAQAHIETLKKTAEIAAEAKLQKEMQEQREKLVEVEDLLMQKVNAITLDDFERTEGEAEKAIKESQGFPLLEKEETRMAARVMVAYQHRINSINQERKIRQDEENRKLDEENRLHNKRWNERCPVLEEEGFEKSEVNNEYVHPLNYSNVSFKSIITMEEDEWTTRFTELKKEVVEFLKNDKAEKARQKKLQNDKKEALAVISKIQDFGNDQEKLLSKIKSAEVVSLMGTIFSDLDTWCQEKANQIDKF